MELNKKIDEMKEELIKAVQEIVKIKSIQEEEKPGMPFGEGVAKTLDKALEVAASLGFHTYKEEGGYYGYAEYGEGQDYVAVLGHMDVVPEGDNWIYPPYGAEIHEGKIFGRGTLDDKSPTIAALFGLKAIKDLKIPLSKKVRIIFGTNEESGSQCMARYIQTEELPAAGFTPDAEYPIIYAEKGVLTLTCHFPFSGDGPVKIVSFKGGVAPNVVAATAQVVIRASAEERRRIASIVDAWNGPERSGFKIVEDGVKGTITIEVQGVPAHGSTPHLGVNAILCLVDILSSMDLMKSQKQFIHALSSLIGMETDGTSLGIAMNDDISGALTLCLGTIDGNESDVHFTLNIRYPVTKKDSLVLDPLREALGIAVTDVRHAAPLYMDPESPLIRTLQKVYKEQTGLNPDLLAIGGGTYAKSVPNVVAFGPIFPGQKYTIHEENECWSIEDLMKNVKIMAHAMVELAR